MRAPALVLALALGATRAWAAPPELSLEDQRERPRRSAELFDGRPVVLVGGAERRTGEAIRDWARLIAARWPAVRVVGLVNLGGLPFFVPKSSVRSGLVEQNPRTPVLCDWEGDRAEALGITGGTVLIVHGRAGEVLGRVEGDPSPDAERRLASLLARTSTTP